MGVVFILMVLVLGYHYTSNYLPAKVVLKRSSGWEAYVHLGKYGLSFLFNGIFSFICLCLFLKITQIAFNLFYHLGANYQPFDFISWMFKETGFIDGVYWFYFIIFILAFIQCHRAVTLKNNNRDEIITTLKSSNSILNLVLESTQTLTPVKISLKSKKVYVGLVDGEQFEQADLDNIVIIPYFSGYRHKDLLDVRFDCNYTEVYKKLNITLDSDESIARLRDFRTIIRLSEIESISLFNLDYYNDFGYFEDKNQNHEDPDKQ